MSSTTHSHVGVLLRLARILAEVNRRMDGRLGAFHGLSFVDLAVLTEVQQSPSGVIRRVDLAEKLGLTQSAVTRILIPLEKIGLVKRRRDPNDARVGFTSITALFNISQTTASSTSVPVPPERGRRARTSPHLARSPGG